jgi:hypothetical protein
MKTTDLYLGGLYNFKAVGDITPYVGLGYPQHPIGHAQKTSAI